MAGSFKKGSGNMPISDINITPLVDVMLVLVIIFLITAPIMTHKIRIDLPQPNPNPPKQNDPPKPINLVIKANGALFMNDVPVTERGLKLQLQVYALKPKDEQPEVQIHVDDSARYDVVAKVLSDAKSVGMQKIGFVND